MGKRKATLYSTRAAISPTLVLSMLSTHLDDDMRALRGGCCANLGPLFRHQDNPSILFVPARILLSFVQDAKVIGLRDANKLTVIAFGPHYAPVIQFVHGRRYPETKNKKMTKFQISNSG